MLVKKVDFALYSPQDKSSLQLASPIAVIPQASYSAILSLAAYLVVHQPHLCPPIRNYPLSKKILVDKKYGEEHLSYNDYYEPWCDYLVKLLENENGFGFQDGDVLYIVGEVQQGWLDQHIKGENVEGFKKKQPNCEKIQQISLLAESKQALKSIFGLEQTKFEIQEKRKVGIANFAISQLRTDPLRPKVHLAGLIQGIWFGNHQWKTYNILKGDYPSEQQFKQMDTLILTGSSLSINDNTPEIQKFIHIVKQAVQKFKHLKILGLCFGHQFLAKAYNGAVVKLTKYAGIERISFEQDLVQKLPFLFCLKSYHMPYLSLSEYHSDYVDTMPDKFLALASSPSCQYQAMISQDYRILSFQFHAEYSTEYTKSYEMRVANYKIQDVLDDFCGTGKPSQEHARSIWAVREAIGKFISTDL